MSRKPLLACDADLAKLKFPAIEEPKIDGVRGCNLLGQMTARSLKPFGNKHISLFFSQQAFRGFDGELAAEHERNPALCRLTTSATSTHEGAPWLMWHVFDYLTPETLNLPYIERLYTMEAAVARIKKEHPLLGVHLKPISWSIVHSLEEFLAKSDQYIEQEYEGIMYRDINGKHKDGRATATQLQLLRVKPVVDVDCRVDKILEGRRNDNEAMINELGYTERSTHQENMIPNGMVGAMDCTLLEDVVFNDKVIHKKGDPIRASAGCMPHDQRALFFVRQDLLLGKRISVRIFPRGVKDKPRHPRFRSFRSDEDTVES
jgi:DNA ligase 1